MPNYTLHVLRFLRFAGLMLLLGSVTTAFPQTVAERAKSDPSFRIYPVTFAVKATKPPVVRVQKVGTLKGSPKIDTVPDAFIKAVEKKVQANPPEPKMKDGKPVEVFTYFFYVPDHPNLVVTDLDKPLDKQP